MSDMEKVIKGLEVCLKNIDQQDCPNDCPYLSDCSKYENRVVFQPLMRDALALLKEQEAVEPIPPTDESDLWKCGNCNHQVFRCTHQKYCEMCGKPVKWK